MRHPAVIGLVAAALALPPAARAATCSVSATELAFGTYRSNSATDVDTTADITVRCVDDGSGFDPAYTISIGPGLNGQWHPRAMRGDAAPLEYNLFVDASRLLVWGDGTGGTTAVSGLIDLPGTTTTTHTAYGTIPARQAAVAPGLYTDLLTITISY